ncbi:MAG: type II secretion system F family protein [Negativicutes bacterium]|jgi:tight adherence protein B
MVLLISVLVFLATNVIILTAYKVLTTEKRMVSKRLDTYIRKPAVPDQRVEQADGAKHGGVRLVIRGISKYIESPRITPWLEHQLMQAGLPIRGSEFLVVCSGAAVLAALILMLFTGKLVVAALGLALGFVIPLIFLRVKIDRRTAAFNNQLGDSLVLIANSLRTGYSFMQAIEMVSKEMPKPISEEFERALKEMSLGVSTEDAMNNLAKRIDSNDLDLVITAVIIQRQVGGNLAEILDNIAATIRARVKMKGKIRTLTAQGRISGIIVGLLPIAVGILIYMMNPEYIKVLFTHPIGRMMLIAGVVSQLLGIIMIRRIINIEV